MMQVCALVRHSVSPFKQDDVDLLPFMQAEDSACTIAHTVLCTAGPGPAWAWQVHKSITHTVRIVLTYSYLALGVPTVYLQHIENYLSSSLFEYIEYT